MVEKYNTIADKWGIKERKLPDFSLYKLPEPVEITLNIPEYVQDGDEFGKRKFIVDIDDKLSIASVLKYHIDNFDEYAKAVSEYVSYGTMVNGEYKSLYNPKESSNGSEYEFFKAAANFPELHPLMANYMLKVIELCKQQKSSGPWSNCEFLLGGFCIEALTIANPVYIPLLVNYMRSHIEIRCEPNYREEFDRVLEVAMQ